MAGSLLTFNSDKNELLICDPPLYICPKLSGSFEKNWSFWQEHRDDTTLRFSYSLGPPTI